MSGNVWEWCQDRYGWYSGESQTNPRGSSSDSYRVLRGGDWIDAEESFRVSDRFGHVPDIRSCWYGFRLCLPQ